MKQENKSKLSLNALTGVIAPDTDMFSLRKKQEDRIPYNSPKYSCVKRGGVGNGESIHSHLFKHKGSTNPEYDSYASKKYYTSPIGGENRRELSILAYIDIVKQHVNKVPKNRRGVLDYRDLIQTGIIGLVEGFDKLDDSKTELEKIKYLKLNIDLKIKESLDSTANPIKISRSQRDKNNSGQNNHPNKWGNMLELDRSMYVEEEKETIADQVMSKQDDLEEYPVHQVLDKLNPIEKEILELNYGLHRSSKMTLQEIADKTRVTLITVKRRKVKAISNASKICNGVRQASEVSQVSWMDSHQIITIKNKTYNVLYTDKGITEFAKTQMKEKEVNNIEDLLTSWELKGEGYWFEDRVKLFTMSSNTISYCQADIRDKTLIAKKKKKSKDPKNAIHTED